MRRKIEAIKPRYFKSEVKKLVKKHGRVLVIFGDLDGDLRKRLLDKEGNCKVSYKGSSYRRWSRFTSSCFMEYSEPYDDYWGHSRKAKKKTLKNTIDAMCDHDDDEIQPLEIRYGKKLSKTLLILRDYKA